MTNYPFIVAEIGCNHMGDMNIAREMVATAADFCQVDAVKFQKRNPKELLSKKEYSAPHPNKANSFGVTYGEHRECLEFNLNQHQQLKKWAEEKGLIYSTSVWDTTSANQMLTLKPKMIKIPSAVNLNFDLIDILCSDYEGEIHLSLGMTTIDEEKEILDFFVKKGRIQDLILYACTSGYPVSFENVCLMEIVRLKKEYGSRLKGIGFSGHHLGIAVDVAAMTLGAGWIERHFTLDRTWKGTDHAASLEPDGLRKVTRDLRNVYEALSYKPREMVDIELEQREKLKRRKNG